MNRRSVLKATGASFAAGLSMSGRPAGAADPPPDREQVGKTESSGPNSNSYQFAQNRRHTTGYIDAGPKHGPVIILVHGWPEFSLAWRHQIELLPLLGFRVIAPDIRGCGQSTRYETHAAYSQREIVRDMTDLADQLQVERAVWVGHDWGAAIVWNIARHHPDRCHAAAGLCVPYDTLERGVDRLVSLVNRQIYPEQDFPAGQFEYVKFYQEHFRDAQASFEANVEGMFKIVMRRGDPAQVGKPFPTAYVRKRGGWFGGGGAPDVPLDRAILNAADLAAYVRTYKDTGFFGVNSLYMNDEDNLQYVLEAKRESVEMPILFLGGINDFVNDTERSELASPMRTECRDLTFRRIDSGHWMQHEQPSEVNAAITKWIATKVPGAWPDKPG